MLFPTLTVLVVEDDPDYRDLIVRGLRRHNVIVATTEREARTALKKARVDARHIDVVSLDLDLPDSKGRETFFSVKGEAGAIPIVVLTGHGQRHVGTELLKYGAADFCAKGDATVKGHCKLLETVVARRAKTTRLAMIGDAAEQDAKRAERDTIPPVPGDDPPAHTGVVGTRFVADSLRYDSAQLHAHDTTHAKVDELRSLVESLIPKVAGNTARVRKVADSQADISSGHEAVKAEQARLALEQGEQARWRKNVEAAWADSGTAKRAGITVGGVTLSLTSVVGAIELVKFIVEMLNG